MLEKCFFEVTVKEIVVGLQNSCSSLGSHFILEVLKEATIRPGDLRKAQHNDHQITNQTLFDTTKQQQIQF